MRTDDLAVAPHIRLCPIDDQVIVLDLLNSRYAGIARARLSGLAGVSMPTYGEPDTSSPSSEASAAVLEQLKSRGWLVERAATTPPPSIEAHIPEAAQTLLPHSASSSAMNLGHAWRCMASAISASWRLHHRSLLAIATGVAEREQTLRERRGDPPEDELVDAVSTYLRLRPLFFSARDRCLHDSLALVSFLAAEGIPARWVIGVRIRPFAAHSWVQHGSLVLNDEHERVRAYRPIFAA